MEVGPTRFWTLPSIQKILALYHLTYLCFRFFPCSSRYSGNVGCAGEVRRSPTSKSWLAKLVWWGLSITNCFWLSVSYVHVLPLIIPIPVLTCSNTGYGTATVDSPLVTPNTDRAAARHGAPGVTPQLLGRVCGRHLSRGLLTRSCYRLSLLGSCTLYSVWTRFHLALVICSSGISG